MASCKTSRGEILQGSKLQIAEDLFRKISTKILSEIESGTTGNKVYSISMDFKSNIPIKI